MEKLMIRFLLFSLTVLLIAAQEIAKQKCNEYYGSLISVRGKEEQYPHLGALGYLHQNTTRFQCTGTLISEQYLLAAAHCALTPNNILPSFVRLGALDLYKGPHQDFEIEKTIIHKDYNKEKRQNNIALFKLKGKVRFSPGIQPSCLETSLEDGGQKLIASGWGINPDDNKEVFQSIPVEPILFEKCKNIYKDKVLNLYEEEHVCLKSKICQPQTGGPVGFVRNEVRYVGGISSFGKYCNEDEDLVVSTKIGKYIKWIENEVWKH